MYTAVLTLHSWTRWLTLLLTIAATVNAFRSLNAAGKLQGKVWDSIAMAAIDLQVLIGLVLYFGLSPFTVQAMNDMSLAMKTPQLRYWGIEHAFGMFVVMILVRVGRIMSASGATPAAERTRRLTCFVLATIVLLLSIPWPGLPYGRPLFRI